MSDFPYVLDANVFIQAHRHYYAFPLCPGFWDAMLYHHGDGQFCSIDRVHKELMDGGEEDPLAVWAENDAPGEFWQSTDDPNVIRVYKQVSRWVIHHPQYKQKAKDDFLKGADPWLIAYCGAYGGTLVTHEQPSPQSQAKIFIPDAAKAFNVTCGNPFKVLAQLKTSFSFNSNPGAI